MISESLASREVQSVPVTQMTRSLTEHRRQLLPLMKLGLLETFDLPVLAPQPRPGCGTLSLGRWSSVSPLTAAWERFRGIAEKRSSSDSLSVSRNHACRDAGGNTIMVQEEGRGHQS